MGDAGKPRLLVVDDDRAIRQLLARVAERTGFAVDVAGDVPSDAKVVANDSTIVVDNVTIVSDRAAVVSSEGHGHAAGGRPGCDTRHIASSAD